MKKNILSIVFLLFAGVLVAQAPKVLSVSPLNQARTAEPMTAVTIDFDQALDPATLNGASIKIFGKWSGPATGVFSLENGGKTARFTPNEPFFAGEVVTVTVNKKLTSVDGFWPEKGYFWQFWIKTSPGRLDQPLVDNTPLRLPGETWIQTYGAYAGDLDNDGWGDLVAVNENSDDLRILLNDGTGSYPKTGFPVIPLGNASASPNEAGDFNNDGEIDLVVTTAHHSETRVLFGNGQGQLSGPTIYTTGSNTRAVAVLDFEFDGDDDILTANRSGSDLSLLTNAGDGTFTMAQLNPTGNGESALALADANNDGLPDFFLGFYGSKKMALLLGDGTGNFNLASEKTVLGSPWMIASGDWNGDGFADVASANSTGNRTAILFGDGQGGLSNPIYLAPPDHIFPIATDPGDLDGDGDVDLVVSCYDSNNYTVFENDGTGQFSVGVVLPAQQNASCAILHDRDNDGDLDITGTDENADVLLFFENTGPSGTDDADGAKPFFARAYPNPAQAGEQFFLETNLDANDDVEVLIFNNLGQTVAQISPEKKYVQGRQVFALNPKIAQSGLFWVQVRVGGTAVFFQKMIVKI